MEELLLQLVLAILELFLEALLEFAGEVLIDLVSRALASVFTTALNLNPLLAALGYTILGALTGGASLSVFPHPLVHSTRFHGISLLISPIVTGLAMSMVGSYLESRDKRVAQIENFGYGFAFAFGMALIRLLFVR
jgi:hypothetical protein